MRRGRRNPITLSKFASAIFIVFFYIVYSKLHPPALTKGQPLPKRPTIQFDGWRNNSMKAVKLKRKRVREAMEHTFRGYRNMAWGHDDIRPVSGKSKDSRNGFGAFIVDSASTLALMSMWEELNEAITHIVDKVDFSEPRGLVDPFETTIRYLGGLVSIVELGDAGIIPNSVLTPMKREGIIKQATLLGDYLLLSYDPRSGLPWPRLDFFTGRVSG